MPASTEINAPNLNSQKHSLMDPHGIRREPLPFPSSFFIYFTPFFDCGTDFLIIRLRITRPVGEYHFILSFSFFSSCHTRQYGLYHIFFHSGGLLSFFDRPSSLSSVSPHGTLRLRSYPPPLPPPRRQVFASKRTSFHKENSIYSWMDLCLSSLHGYFLMEGHPTLLFLSVPDFCIRARLNLQRGTGAQCAGFGSAITPQIDALQADK